MINIRNVDLAWLMLLVLTFGGGLMGKHAQPGLWVTLVIALVTLIKGRLVIKHFMELEEASPLIRRVVTGFCVIIPVLMVATYIWSAQLVSFSQSILGD